jgi:hypothetical protein
MTLIPCDIIPSQNTNRPNAPRIETIQVKFNGVLAAAAELERVSSFVKSSVGP